MSNRPFVPAALLAVAVVVGACSSPGASAAPSAPPSGSPAASASPASDAIEHPSGAGDIVLRYDQSGGFVPVEFMASHVPYFTLYGDGTVVFVSSQPVAPPAEGGPSVNAPLRTATLREEQIQELLRFALVEGGLAAARTDYPNPLVADAPSTVFEVHAANDAKTVSIMALGMDDPSNPTADSAIKAAFLKLAERLQDFDQGGAIPSAAYEPEAYRGILIEAAGVQGVPVREWPWSGIAPADFKLPADPNAFQQRSRLVTPAEAEEIGVAGYQGGIGAGLYFKGPDGKLYGFVLRPLLPDEAA